MAEESMLDKAMALLPGVGSTKARAKPKSHAQRLSAVQKSLAKLAKDVEKLSGIIASQVKKAPPATKRAAKTPAARKTTARKTAARKSPARRKSARKKS